MRETVTIVGNPVAGSWTTTLSIPFIPKKMILRNFALSIPGQTAAPTNRVLLLRCPAITNRNANLIAFCVDVTYSLSGAAVDELDLSYTLTTDTEFEVNNNLNGGSVSFSIVSIAGVAPTGVTWTNSEVALIMEFINEDI